VFDANRIEASLKNASSPKTQERIKAQGGAEALRRALGAKSSVAEEVGKAVAQERQEKRLKYGVTGTKVDLPSQQPPPESAPEWVKRRHEAIFGQAPARTAANQAADAPNLAKPEDDSPQNK
jgi:hypothetical protein